MEGAPKGDTIASDLETKIAVDEPTSPIQQPRAYNENQARQAYYYEDPNYRQNPAFQQRVGGQNVYIAGGYPQEPPNAARAPMYRINQPGQQDESQYYQQYMNEIFTDAFDSVKIRNRFVQRVYMILALQLFASFGFLLFVTYVMEARIFFIRNHMVVLIVSMIMYMGVYIALVCSVDLRRNFPINFIMLAILTVGLTLMMAPIVALTPPIIVLAAIGTTAAVCLIVSIFACQTKWDVTACGMCMCIAMVVFMIYGLVLMILMLVGIYIPALHIVYSAIGCLLFVFWLMYDTQMIIGGHRIELSPEEYIFGALTLYVDIMIIFMHILALYHHCLGGGSGQ